jgi:hypothetical protein
MGVKGLPRAHSFSILSLGNSETKIKPLISQIARKASYKNNSGWSPKSYLNMGPLETHGQTFRNLTSVSGLSLLSTSKMSSLVQFRTHYVWHMTGNSPAMALPCQIMHQPAGVPMCPR